ncbi:hypothetical protein SETIT_7G043200v2 [Setaria italica]|uniref:SCP domain-containing protein n=2 Tax=Setaria italica TaxID=4555 RepID=A0A368RRS0_SETIT|nr:hypothetical protein SETIT_7G043200v2 [Setaria italica]
MLAAMRAFKDIDDRLLAPQIQGTGLEIRLYIHNDNHVELAIHPIKRIAFNNQIMARTRMSSLWSILLLLALSAALCTRSAAATNDDDGSYGTDLDAGRRARSAATVAEILSVHNEARREVGVPPLVWSPQIAGYAKGFAQSRRGDCAPRRSPLFYFGENVVVGKGRHWNATALAAPWVAEGQWYDYGSNSCAAPPGAGCLRYTQVVWRNTTQVGCARIVCGSNDTLLVCDYFPPGNYGTGRPY